MAADTPLMPQSMLSDLMRVEHIAHWVLMHSSFVNIPEGLVSIEHLNQALAQAFEAGRRAQALDPPPGQPPP